jgi:hypothetical protein
LGVQSFETEERATAFMNTTVVSIVLGIGGMIGWGIYDFLGGAFQNKLVLSGLSFGPNYRVYCPSFYLPLWLQ